MNYDVILIVFVLVSAFLIIRSLRKIFGKAKDEYEYQPSMQKQKSSQDKKKAKRKAERKARRKTRMHKR